MSASDRHRIHNRFEELFGPDDAGIVMEYLSPRPWDQIATKDDLKDLRDEMREMERRIVDHIDVRVEAAVGRANRSLYLSLAATNATIAGAIVGGVAALS